MWLKGGLMVAVSTSLVLVVMSTSLLAKMSSAHPVANAVSQLEPRFFPAIIAAITASQWFVPVAVTVGGTVASLPLGLYNTFREDEEPGTPTNTRIRVWAGQDRFKNSSQSLNGNFPEFKTYDEFGNLIGRADEHPMVGEGNFVDQYIKPYDGNNIRPSYLQVIMHETDPICISAIVVTFPDGGSAMITGDLMVLYCGWPGYFDSLTWIRGDEGQQHQPKCFWMDENDDYDECANGPWKLGRDMPRHISFKLADMHAANETQDAYNKHKGLICKNHRRMFASHRAPIELPVFDPILQYPTNYTDRWNNTPKADYLDTKYIDGVYPSITYKPCKRESGAKDASANGSTSTGEDDSGDNETGSAVSPHASKKWRQQNLGQYQISHSSDPMRSATFSCKFPNIKGPDWLNMHERKYCDNENNVLYDLCDVKRGITENCFDLENEELRGAYPESPNGEVLLALPPRILKTVSAQRKNVDKNLEDLVNIADSGMVDVSRRH